MTPKKYVIKQCMRTIQDTRTITRHNYQQSDEWQSNGFGDNRNQRIE